jgi:hypothetical protein
MSITSSSIKMANDKNERSRIHSHGVGRPQSTTPARENRPEVQRAL